MIGARVGSNFRCGDCMCPDQPRRLQAIVAGDDKVAPAQEFDPPRAARCAQVGAFTKTGRARLGQVGIGDLVNHRHWQAFSHDGVSIPFPNCLEM